MAKRTKKLTNEARLEGWYKAARQDIGYSQLMEAGWEAGQVGHITVNGINYERFFFDDGTFVVVEWDEDGNVCC